MTRTSARQTKTALMILTSFAFALALFAGTGVAHAQEVFTCDKWASSSGNDANDGSKARPVLTVNVLASKLQPGQTGCLAAGETVHMGAGGTGIVAKSGLAGSPITIRSAPEGRAALTGHMRIDGNNVVVRDIDFRGLGERGDLYPKSNHIHVVGDNVSILDNDITSPKGICVSVGTIASYLPQDDPNQTANSARNFVLDGNRIHGCGLQTTLVSTDSGMHGVYLAYTEDARITNNFIYDNRVRGLQLYSRAERTLVEHNVIDGNSGNLNIGGSSHEGGYFVSRDTTVRNNIISNSTFAWPKDQYQVVGNYKTTATATEYNNLVTGNCVYHQDASKNFGGTGISQSNNLSSNPMYVNRGGKNFALQANSPCAGKGPQTTGGDTTAPTSNVYPSAGSTDVTTTMVAATFSEAMMASSINANTFTLKKTSDNSAVNGTVSYTSVGHEARFTPAASLAADTQYTATLNGVKDLAGNAHALKSWSFRTASATSGTCQGAAATITGTDGNDALTGTEGVDVIAGLGGNDTIRGLGGNDTICGGDGYDTFSGGAGDDTLNGEAGGGTVNYSASPAPVNVDLGTGQATGEGSDKLTGILDVTGSGYNDIITGNTMNSYFVGGAGNDKLYGLSGNDSFYGNDGSDTIDGGLGTDTANYKNAKAAVVVNLTKNEAFDPNDGINAAIGYDSLLGLENVTGSEYADTIYGADDANGLTKNGNNNVLSGFGGNDTVYGMSGNDRLVGGVGNDKLYGNAGDDYLDSRDGVSGNDTVDGGSGTDSCRKDATEAALIGCESYVL